MKSIEERKDEIILAVEMADVYLSSSKDTLIMTSRELIIGKSECTLDFLFPPPLEPIIPPLDLYIRSLPQNKPISSFKCMQPLVKAWR